METETTSRGRKLFWWLGGGVAVIIVLAVAGPFIYIHFIEGPPPAKLALPVTGGTSSSAATPASGDGIAGTWHVGSGSQAGYRVSEVLIGQKTTAVGRTSEISGSITIAGTSVTAGTFTVDMASVKSDQSARNAQFDSARIMDTATYPTATLTLTQPIALGTVPTTGSTHRYTATGTLAMHGKTEPITFTVEAARTSKGINALADIPITFARWGVANPSIGGFVTTADNGTLEALLVLTTGAGNPSAASATTTTAPPSGGPITVPSTTTPPLGISPES